MKIPDQVLEQFNEAFLRPRMRFAPEYFDAERRIERYNREMHGLWMLQHDVKKKLYTEEAKPVVDAWIAFVDAILRTNKFRGVFCAKTCTVNTERAAELKRRWIVQNTLEENLRILVYGEKKWR